ncbi:MAG: RNA-binding S4 domain-containing protein [Hyphomicrobium sp.]
MRIDKWLWFSRLFKSRTVAAALCQSGRLRINGVIVQKAHQGLKPGDVLTFPKADYIRVIRVIALGSRRGPAPEAQSLYEDLDPPTPEKRLGVEGSVPGAVRRSGSQRPTKAGGHATDNLRSGRSADD